MAANIDIICDRCKKSIGGHDESVLVIGPSSTDIFIVRLSECTLDKIATLYRNHLHAACAVGIITSKLIEDELRDRAEDKP